MSWCLMQEKVTEVQTDIESIYRRVGGRNVNDGDQEPRISMTDVRVLNRLSIQVKVKVKVKHLDTCYGAAGLVTDQLCFMISEMTADR